MKIKTFSGLKEKCLKKEINVYLNLVSVFTCLCKWQALRRKFEFGPVDLVRLLSDFAFSPFTGWHCYFTVWQQTCHVILDKLNFQAETRLRDSEDLSWGKRYEETWWRGSDITVHRVECNVRSVLTGLSKALKNISFKCDRNKTELFKTILTHLLHCLDHYNI